MKVFRKVLKEGESRCKISVTERQGRGLLLVRRVGSGCAFLNDLVHRDEVDEAAMFASERNGTPPSKGVGGSCRETAVSLIEDGSQSTAGLVETIEGYLTRGGG